MALSMQFSRVVGWLLLCSCFLLQPLYAHEYWVDPLEAWLQPGETLRADIRNGQDFNGISFPYDPQRYARFYIVGPGQRVAVKSRLGDSPAVHQALEKEGLYSIVLESAERALQYDTLEKFRTFLDYHGLQQVEAVHRRRRLPETNIQERYFRFAKALVQVGDPDEGRDGAALSSQNMLFELQALNNPYADNGELRVKLLFQQQPLSGVQVEIFRSVNKNVTRTVTTTDANGEAHINIAQPGEYLVNAVQLIQPRRGKAHWESLWASLTFNRQ